MSSLSALFMILAALAVAGVVASFIWGTVAMTRGREEDRKTSNRMMQLRVWSQGLVLLFLALAYITR